MILFLKTIFTFFLLNLFLANTPLFSARPQAADTLSIYLKGYMENPSGSNSCNACVENVIVSVNSLQNHGETLGFNWGADYPEVKGAGTPNHWQGVQRLQFPGLETPYFIVASSHRNLIITPDRSEEVSSPAHFAVVQMNSQKNNGGRLRSNRLEYGQLSKDVLPNQNDKIVHSQIIDEHFDHPGGIQTIGAYVLIGVDRPATTETDSSLITLWDMSNPLVPRKVWHNPDWKIEGRDATAVGIIKLEDGRYLMVRALRDSKTLEFYILKSNLEINPANYDEDPLWDRWDYTELKSELLNSDGTVDLEWSDLGSILGEAGYQSTTIVRECQTSQLYLIASHGRRPSGFGGTDEVDAFRLDVPKDRPNPNVRGEGIELTKVAKKILFPGGNAGARQGDLQAAAGSYVSPDHHFYFYATEHGTTQESKFVQMIGFSPQIPTSDVTMLNDAWVELYDGKNFDGRSIILDYIDRHKRDYRDFRRIEAFDSLASSVIYAIPPGFKLRLYSGKHETGNYFDLIGTGRPEKIADLSNIRFANGEAADNAFSSAIWQGVITALNDKANYQNTKDFELKQNYPNPFNPETSLQYRIFQQAKVTLEIYDIRGRLLKVLIQKRQSPGFYSVKWDGTDSLGQTVASGTYLYRLTVGDITQVKTLTVLR